MLHLLAKGGCLTSQTSQSSYHYQVIWRRGTPLTVARLASVACAPFWDVSCALRSVETVVGLVVAVVAVPLQDGCHRRCLSVTLCSGLVTRPSHHPTLRSRSGIGSRDPSIPFRHQPFMARSFHLGGPHLFPLPLMGAGIPSLEPEMSSAGTGQNRGNYHKLE